MSKIYVLSCKAEKDMYDIVRKTAKKHGMTIGALVREWLILGAQVWFERKKGSLNNLQGS